MTTAFPASSPGSPSPAARRNQFTAGAVFDRGTVNYTQNTQYGYLLPSAAIAGVPAWQDGSTSVDGSPVDSRVNLHGVTPNWSFYATDTFSLAKDWNLTVSGRYNRTVIHNTDLLNPPPAPVRSTAIMCTADSIPRSGSPTTRCSSLNVYANYSQASRAPTSIELGCADPNNPCSLPNALSSDPPLNQVVTTTWEAGLRGKLEQYHIELGPRRVSSRESQRHSVRRVARDRHRLFPEFRQDAARRGCRRAWTATFNRVSVGLDYTLLSATYQSVETLDGTANNTSDIALSGYPGVGGVITVHPGNRIPLIPKQSGKAFVDIQATKKFVFESGDGRELERLRARQRKQRLQGRRRVLSGTRSLARLRGSQLRGALRSDPAFATGRPDRQPFRPSLLHGGADREHSVHQQRHAHLPAFSGIHQWTSSREFPASERNVFRAGRSEKGLGRPEVEVLMDLDYCPMAKRIEFWMA